MAETEDSGVMSLTVTLLSAYFANNTVPSSELPALVEGTRRALLGDTPVATPVAAPVAEEVAPETPVAAPVTEEIVPETPVAAQEYVPKVSIEESVASPDHILSLIDGKPYKTLKRHLAAQGLTPAEYRGRYGLPADYPMVAQGYSAARREVALKLGLGGKRKAAARSSLPELAAGEKPITDAVIETSTAKLVRPGRRKANAKEEKVTETPSASKRKTASGKASASVSPVKPKRSRVSKDIPKAASGTGVVADTSVSAE